MRAQAAGLLSASPVSQQRAWQMALICIRLLEQARATSNRSRSFSFQNLQQIGQNGNYKTPSLRIPVSTIPALNRVNDSLSNCVIPPNVY